MSQPRPHQFSTEGLGDGDYAFTVDGGVGSWSPVSSGSGVVETIVAGANVTVDDTDPANPIVSATGDIADLTYPLDPATLNVTYGDHFAGSSLDAKWTRVGYVSGDETYQAGGGSYLYVDTARAAGNYYYQTAPAGDFTVVMKGFFVSGSSVMWGPLILDSSGNGVQCATYNSPEAVWCFGVASGTYNSTGAQRGKVIWAASPNRQMWWKLRKSGTNYYSSVSLNGLIWQRETAAFSKVFTPARIGFGCITGTPESFGVDWFDVQ